MPGFNLGASDQGNCEDIEEQLNLVSLALDAAGDSIIIHRPDGTLVRFNRAAADQMGITVEQFDQLPPWGWAQPMSPEARRQRTAILREHGENAFVSQLTLADGQVVLHDVHTRWVEAPGGPYIVAVSRDVTEQSRAREVLENLAFHDPLTGVANRALFEDRLELAMSSARRHNELLGVAYLDLDDFKDINDGYGHSWATRFSSRSRSGSRAAAAARTRSRDWAVTSSPPSSRESLPSPTSSSSQASWWRAFTSPSSSDRCGST